MSTLCHSAKGSPRLCLTRLLCPQVMDLLPAHQGDDVVLFVNKLEGARD